MRRVSRSPVSDIGSLVGKADADVVLAIETLAARSQEVAGSLAAQQASVDALGKAAAPPSFSDIKRALQVNGGNALDVTGLAGLLAQPQRPGVPMLTTLPNAVATNNGELVNLNGTLYYLDARTDPGQWKPIGTGAIYVDTHANRLANFPAANYIVGTVFWESDRTAMYYVAVVAGVNAWVLMFTRPQIVVSIAALPADLGTNDAGYLATVVNDTIGQFSERWTGTQWNFHRGWYRATEANRPAIADCDAEFLFVSLDYGEQVWRNSTSAWELWPGFGGPMRDTLSPDHKPTLGTDDAGFRFYSTDFYREFTWDGSAWDYSSGELKQQSIIPTFLNNSDSGWLLCNGSVQNVSDNNGNVNAVTLPNLSGGRVHITANNATGAGTFAAVGGAYNYYDLVFYMKM